MPVNPKPFSAAEKIKRSVFAGKPSVFSAQDINRQFDATSNFIDKLSEVTGPLRENWETTLNTSSINVVGPNRELTLDVSVVKINAGLGAHVHTKGVQMDVPETLNMTGTFSVADPNPVAAYVFLVAEKHTVTFGEDPILSGINSTEFPTQQPSSDTIVYRNERLVLTDDVSNITLGAEEEVIVIISSIVEQIRTTSDGSNEGVDAKSLTIRYNASTIEDIIAQLSFDDTIGGTSGNIFASNNSLMDALNVFVDYQKQLDSKSAARIEGVRADLDADLSSLASKVLSNTFTGTNTFDNNVNFKIEDATLIVSAGAELTLPAGNIFYVDKGTGPFLNFITPRAKGAIVWLIMKSPLLSVAPEGILPGGNIKTADPLGTQGNFINMYEGEVFKFIQYDASNWKACPNDSTNNTASTEFIIGQSLTANQDIFRVSAGTGTNNNQYSLNAGNLLFDRTWDMPELDGEVVVAPNTLTGTQTIALPGVSSLENWVNTGATSLIGSVGISSAVQADHHYLIYGKMVLITFDIRQISYGSPSGAITIKNYPFTFAQTTHTTGIYGHPSGASVRETCRVQAEAGTDRILINAINYGNIPVPAANSWELSFSIWAIIN